METRVSYTTAGTFVLILLTLIVLGVIWLSSGFSNQTYNCYLVYMTESVSGLSKDGPVEFNGVEVGTVKKMKINKSNPELVELTLHVKSDTPVTHGTKAKLGVRALTGVAYILLEDKGTDMRPLVAEKDQPFPIIPTTPSILVRLDTTLTQISDSFQQLSKSVKSLLSEQNLKSIKVILHSGQNTMRILQNETLPATNQAIDNLSNLSSDLSDVAAEIKQNPSVLIRGRAQPSRTGPGER